MRGERAELAGMRFGRITILAEAQKDRRGMRRWLGICDCGAPVVARTAHLINGAIKSCGCYSHETIAAKHRTHGMTNTTAFHRWQRMKAVTTNPNHPKYKDYGGRGIKMCKRWFDSFEAFYEDVGPIPDGMTIHRKDNDGNYEPDNWEFANQEKQQNNRRDTIWLKYKGRLRTLSEWARELIIKRATLYARIYIYHWSIEKAFTTPVEGSSNGL